MGFEVEVTHQRVDLPEDSPVVVYAKLASCAAERPSFLLESLAPDSEAGRYSVTGYRALRGEGMPPNVDAIRDWFEGVDADGPEQLAEAIVQGMVGYAPACAASREHGLLLYPDEFLGATFTRGSTVMVFDHHEKRAVVAGPVAGRAVERLIWELGRAAEIADPLPLGDAVVETKAMVGDEQYAARAKRAQGFIADELEEVVLANTLLAAPGGAQALEVYRCWRQATDKAAGFFLDFGAPPPQNRQLALFGFSSVALFVDRGAANGSDAVFAQLPHRQMSGVPNILAAKVARRLEENSRGVWGGVIGYVGRGGGAALYLAEDLVLLDSGTFWLTAGGCVREDSEPATVMAQIHARLEMPLRAIETVRAAAPPKEEETPDDAAEVPSAQDNAPGNDGAAEL